jgi:hypothetical protein
VSTNETYALSGVAVWQPMQVTGAGAPESEWLCCLMSEIFSTDAVVSLPTPKPRSSDPDAHLDTSF